MKIINETDLSYKIIGMIIDELSQEQDDTHYYGQIEWTTFEYMKKEYRVQIRYLKKYIEWRFYEKNI